MQAIRPNTLTSNIAFISSREASSAFSKIPNPALFTRISTGPASWNAAFMSSVRLTSNAIMRHFAPVSSAMFCFKAMRRSFLRAARMTSAPSLAAWYAIRSPSPPEAPVIITFCSFNFCCMFVTYFA
ncbi:hypothetical protein CHCC4186_0100 [Bacillus paralicheniformis]|nr:hypothetical protein CHCC4186_0100 [Bacillus paralicheniformis]